MTISIIIPIYNVAPYVVQCLQSVASQTYHGEMECLLIDDCGTDDSMSICEQFITSYDGPISFRLIHHEQNRGLSAARNTGIDASTGDWIFFLDSDDSVTSDCIQKMVETVEKEPDIDMVMGQINTVGDNLNWDNFGPPGVHTDGFIEKACSYKIYTMAWNRLIRRRYITDNKLYFVEGLLHEDELWNVQTACKLNKLVIIPDATYNYLIRENSIQTNKSKAIHRKHLGQVKVLLLSFIFRNHLEKNKTLFNFITHNISSFICEDIEGNKDIAYQFYYKYRNAPYWTLSEIEAFGYMPLGRKILEINRKLPIKIGFYYFRLVMWLVNKKNNI